MQAEAVNLLSAMLLKDAAARPAMPGVNAHPMWWSAETKLQFLADVSDRWGGERQGGRQVWGQGRGGFNQGKQHGSVWGSGGQIRLCNS
eukprot:323223-Chlamydomonas_euryale.AAC.1